MMRRLLRACRIAWTRYKLVLYDNGGFSKTHKDTEKERGMFELLVVCCCASQARLWRLVRHNGKQKVFDFSGACSGQGCFTAAFYTDCDHGLLEDKGSMRLCLLYNLVRTAKAAAPLVARTEHIAALRRATSKWEASDEASEPKFVLLESAFPL